MRVQTRRLLEPYPSPRVVFDTHGCSNCIANPCVLLVKPHSLILHCVGEFLPFKDDAIMVRGVHYIALSIVLAAAAFKRLEATSLECNAYMPTGIDLPLNDDHPAVMKDYNGAVPVELPLDQCDVLSTERGIPIIESTGALTRRLRRMEDATTSDVQDLETYYNEPLVKDFSTLKTQFASASSPTIPWPGSYWPTYKDSINVVWNTGDQSASEKYAKAYGLNPTELQNQVSAVNGVDAHANKTKCTTDAACTAQNDASVCAKRTGAGSGYCIPTWYGICHAWAPAAILEAEPQCDVVKNGQTFRVLDIKALVTAVYDGSAISTVFTGARFNGPDTPAATDAYGRFVNAARRDVGAGFFHLAITTIMGKHKQSFIIDVTAGTQVWNQPVRSYEVQAMDLVDVAHASQQYFGTTVYPFNAQMVYLAFVKTSVRWIVEAYADGPLVATQRVDTYTASREYEYLLELDANYAVIGGEWVGRSKVDHPDFLWFPTSKPDPSTITKAGLSYAHVKELLDLSVSCGAVNPSASTSGSASDSTSPDTPNSVASMSASGSLFEPTDTTEASTGDAHGSTGDDPFTVDLSLETIEDDGLFYAASTVPALLTDSTDAIESTGTATSPTPIDSGYYTPPPTSDTDVPSLTTLSEEIAVGTPKQETIETSMHQSCH